MFKVSQEIYLNSSDSANLSNIYGTYKKSENDGYKYFLNSQTIKSAHLHYIIMSLLQILMR